MELKPRKTSGVVKRFAVLIVPSGIETIPRIVQEGIVQRVLIVPSGIETRLIILARKFASYVLIVPSGIETR